MPRYGGRRANSGRGRYNPYGRRPQPHNLGGDGGGASGSESSTGYGFDMRDHLQSQGHQNSGYRNPRFHDPRLQDYRYHDPQYGNNNSNGHGPWGLHRMPPPAPPYNTYMPMMPNGYYQPQVDPRGYQQGNQYHQYQHHPPLYPRPLPISLLTMVESVTVGVDGRNDMRVYNTSRGNGEKENFCARLNAGTNIWAAYTDGSNASIMALNGMFPPGIHRSIIIKFHDN